MSIKRIQKDAHIYLTEVLGRDYEKHTQFKSKARILANSYSKFTNHRPSVIYPALLRYPKELKLMELLDVT